MNSFPLYDTLINEISSNSLSVKEKEYFISQIKIIDNKGRDLVYALIQYYYINNIDNEENIKNIPYKGIIMSSNNNNTVNVRFIFTDLPTKLQIILYNYVKKHQKHIKENKRNVI